LDALLIAEPQNVELWQAYMQLRQEPAELYWLKERALHTPELSDMDKQDISAYYDFLVRKLSQSKTDVEETPKPEYTPPTIMTLPQESDSQTIMLEPAAEDEQDEQVYYRPRTMVFEYAEELSKLSEKIIQPVGEPELDAEPELEFQIKFDLGSLNIQHGVLVLSLLALISGIKFVGQDNFFGYWLLLGSMMVLLYWFINHTSSD
jgi:hypothetical protein